MNIYQLARQDFKDLTASSHPKRSLKFSDLMKNSFDRIKNEAEKHKDEISDFAKKATNTTGKELNNAKNIVNNLPDQAKTEISNNFNKAKEAAENEIKKAKEEINSDFVQPIEAIVQKEKAKLQLVLKKIETAVLDEATSSLNQDELQIREINQKMEDELRGKLFKPLEEQKLNRRSLKSTQRLDCLKDRKCRETGIITQVNMDTFIEVATGEEGNQIASLLLFNNKKNSKEALNIKSGSKSQITEPIVSMDCSVDQICLAVSASTVYEVRGADFVPRLSQGSVSRVFLLWILSSVCLISGTDHFLVAGNTNHGIKRYSLAEAAEGRLGFDFFSIEAKGANVAAMRQPRGTNYVVYTLRQTERIFVAILDRKELSYPLQVTAAGCNLAYLEAEARERASGLLINYGDKELLIIREETDLDRFSNKKAQVIRSVRGLKTIPFIAVLYEESELGFLEIDKSGKISSIYNLELDTSLELSNFEYNEKRGLLVALSDRHISIFDLKTLPKKLLPKSVPSSRYSCNMEKKNTMTIPFSNFCKLEQAAKPLERLHTNGEINSNKIKKKKTELALSHNETVVVSSIWSFTDEGNSKKLFSRMEKKLESGEVGDEEQEESQAYRRNIKNSRLILFGLIFFLGGYFLLSKFAEKMKRYKRKEFSEVVLEERSFELENRRKDLKRFNNDN